MDGHGRIELAMFHTPTAISAEPTDAPANTLGIRRIMFAVNDIEDVVARLRTHGAELVGELARPLGVASTGTWMAGRPLRPTWQRGASADACVRAVPCQAVC